MKTHTARILITVFLTTLLSLTGLLSCKTKESTNNTIIVSIAPLKGFVEDITCGDFMVEVLVPEGSSPETYSPTPQQIIQIEKAAFVFTTGLIDFETELVDKISKSLISNNKKITPLSKNIPLLSGTCSHSHDDLATHDGHHHGTDPHIWTSPEQLKVIAENIYNTIISIYPDSVKYTDGFRDLYKKIDSLSIWVEGEVKASNNKKFLIYHPALAYYANDYELEQISIENEGKEPSATHMKSIIDEARLAGIKSIMYQREFPRSVVEPIAKELDAEIVEINPLSEDILNEIRKITFVIARK